MTATAAAVGSSPLPRWAVRRCRGGQFAKQAFDGLFYDCSRVFPLAVILSGRQRDAAPNSRIKRMIVYDMSVPAPFLNAVILSGRQREEV